MKKRKPFPIFRLLGVVLVGNLFFGFYYLVAKAVNFWPIHLFGALTIVLCVQVVRALIEEWQRGILDAAPGSSLPSAKSKIVIKQGRDKANGIWACWIDGPPRMVSYNEVPGKALACLLAGLGYPPDYQIVDANPNRPGES